MVDGAALPAGVRFYPTEQELVGFYLRNKLEHKRPDMERFIPVVDVYSYEPMELPLMSGEASVGDPEQWFFFCPRQAREAQGGRPTRTTRSGFWKATGSATPVFHNHRVIGIRKTMVFYHGRAPTGRKTPWKMNEYRAAAALQLEEAAAAAGEEQAAATSSTAAPPYNSPAPAANSGADLIKWRSEFSLCRVYKKSGHLRSFDRRPIVRVERDQNPAGVDDDGGVHVVPTSTSRPPPADHDTNNAAASAMADDGDQMIKIYRSGSSSDGRPQDQHDDVLANMDLDGGADGDCDDLEGLDWDSLIAFDGMI